VCFCVRFSVCITTASASLFCLPLPVSLLSNSFLLSLLLLSLRLSRSLSERGNPKGEGEVKSVRNSPPVSLHSLPALPCLILPTSDSFFYVVGRCGEMCRQPAFSRRQFPRFVYACALVRLATHGSHDPLPGRYHCIPLLVPNTSATCLLSLLQHCPPALFVCACVRARGSALHGLYSWTPLRSHSLPPLLRSLQSCPILHLNTGPYSLAFAALSFSQSCACTRSLFPIPHDA